MKRSSGRATVLEVDVRARSTPAPGLRPVLLVVLLSMALTADMRIASAAPSGAGEGVAPPPVDGAIGTETWSLLLTFDPVRPRWAGRRAKRGGGATASRALPPRRPLSASLPAKAYEIDPGPAP